MRAVFIGLVLLAASGCGHDDLPVATNVDLQQFEGKWYEVAHLPRPTQRDCTGTIATYTRQPDGTFSFVHECTLTNGSYYGATATASLRDAKTPAKLAVDFGGYVGDYWILEVAPDYRYAVVGHPSRDYLWIMSRTPTLAPFDQEAVLAHAKQNGFDTTALEYTPPAPLAEGTPAPPVKYGCAASPGPSRGEPWLLALLLALAARARRRRTSADCTPNAPGNPRP